MTETALPEADRIEGVAHPRDTVQLIGQEEAEARFIAAHRSGRAHHAWLIAGPRGIGKATLGWKITRFLLTQPAEEEGGLFAGEETPPRTLETDPDHPVNQRLNALSEPRFFLLRRPYDDKAGRLKQEIPVDEVRRLKSFLALSAADGGHRVVLIDSADEMNVNAANALLKLLEEPPSDTTLILISHQPSGLLPTIRSRCRLLRCAPLAEDDLRNVLDGHGIDLGGQAAALSELAGGSAGRALELMKHDGLALYAEIVAILATYPSPDRARLNTFAETHAGRGREERFRLTLELYALFLSRLARAGIQPPEHQAARGEATLFARLCPNARAARLWAEAAEVLGARAAHGRRVNLDPAALILDMVFKTEETASRAAQI